MPLQFQTPQTPNMLQLLRPQSPVPGNLPLPYPDVPTQPQTLQSPAAASPPPTAGPQQPPESANLAAQLQKINAPPTVKDGLIKAALAFAPTAIAGAVGGLPAAAGAAQGANTGLAAEGAAEAQQKKDLLVQLESARGREERMAERQLTTHERADESLLRQKEIEGTNALRMETAKGANQNRLDIQDLKNTVAGQNAGAKNKIAYRRLGLDESGNPIPREQLTPGEQSKLDLNDSIEELHAAQAEVDRAKNDTNSPAFKLAQQRVQVAQQNANNAINRLGLSQQTFDARYHGTDSGGTPLPGAMIANNGQPVGSSFSQNVRPTGTERNKGDMAVSAKEQIDDIRRIMQNRQDIFGPAAGRKTDFTVWLGSQDPDAQRFLSARTIAADHMAGTFGGRSEAALQALDSAIGQFKDNPQAALAGLDQLEKATNVFVDKGTVKTVGSNATLQKAPTAAPSTPAKAGRPPLSSFDRK